MTDPTREAFEAWYAKNDNTGKSVARDATGYRLIQTQSAWEAWQAALSARAQGEELNDWLDLLELPEGYEVEEFLPGVYHYINWLDGVKKVGGDWWNHPALAAISAWQNTTPAVRAVDLDGFTFTADEVHECIDHLKIDGPRLIPDEIMEQMRTALLALTQPEAE